MAKRHIRNENRERITKLPKKKLGIFQFKHTHSHKHILTVKVSQLHKHTHTHSQNIGIRGKREQCRRRHMKNTKTHR